MAKAHHGPAGSSRDAVEILNERLARQAVSCRFTLLPDEAQAILRHEHALPSYLLDLYGPSLTDTTMLTRGQEILDLLHTRLASRSSDERERFFMMLYVIFQMNANIDALPAFLVSDPDKDQYLSHTDVSMQQKLPEAILLNLIRWLNNHSGSSFFYPTEMSMLARGWLHICEVVDLRAPHMPR